MPQAPRSGARQDSKESRRALEKESKRAQGAMSCAECRRLKLKCDKTIPCSSCQRRGCSQICPNGSLVTGQGTRFVLADTEKLHDKINTMSDRIRQLEDALSLLQSTISHEQHPLLQKDLLQIKSILELHGAFNGDSGKSKTQKQEEEIDAESQYIDAFGTLAIRDDGATTFYGRSAGSESLLIGELSGPSLERKSPQQSSWHPQLPENIRQYSTSFPFAPPAQHIDLNYVVQNFLPSWEDTWHLIQLYLEQAPWFYIPVTRRQVMEEMLPTWYPAEATRLNHSGFSIPQPSMSGSGPGIENGPGSAHELALLFICLAFGALTDISLPPLPDNPEAERYYQLTCTALALEPVLDRPPLVSTVQTLSLMAIYQGLLGEHNLESTWTIFGMATKLAQSLGLHRDPARWKVSPFEVQKRRALFWELFITDSWLGLATGRLATFSLPFVDCELALDPDETMADDGTPMASFPAWKARFGAQCMAYVAQGALTARAPKYSVILELDRRIRDMPLPKYSYDPPPQGAGLLQTMSHYMPINYRHFILIYVHRCFFAEAINDSPQNPMKSQYSPSFLAGYHSACELLSIVRIQFYMFPAHVARFWTLWTHTFSGTVLIASIVTRATGAGVKSKVTSAAMLQLKSACELFADAASYGGRAAKFLPILRRLLQKAEDVISGSTLAPLHNDIFAPSTQDEKKDEFQIFSGQTHTVATKANNSPSQARATRHKLNQASMSSSIPSENQQHSHVYPEMHPMLADQLNEFEGHLNAQIHNAYENSSRDIESYIPVASSSYNDPIEQQPSSAQYYNSQQYGLPVQYSYPSTSRSSYQQPVYDSRPTSYDYANDHSASLQYSQPVQSQHWSYERQHANTESFSSEGVPNYAYSDFQQLPAQPADQHSLQNTWSSFVHTVGSPPPFAMD